jgi:alkylated DNA repair dioxygenase AlkB
MTIESPHHQAAAKASKQTKRAAKLKKEPKVRPQMSDADTYFRFLPFEAHDLLNQCVQEVADLLHHRPPVPPRYGKKANQNRDVGFFSDTVANYAYSGQSMPAQHLTPGLVQLLTAVSAQLGEGFNAVLVNRYNTGKDFISPHSDDEGLIGSVASLSWGASRCLRFRGKVSKKLLHDTDLHAYSFLQMLPGCQEALTHDMPKQLRVKDARVSFTFRRHQLA